MAEKPNDNPEDFEAQSNFPESNDPALNTKIAGMVRALGIEQSPQEFVDDLEGDLVASVNKAARMGAKQKIPPQVTTSVNDEDEIPPLNKYPIEEQEKIVAKKLKLYRKTQENIKKEITRLLAISGNKELSPANANKINRLISNMRSLDDRMALYTKKDEAFRKQRQQQEQRMLQQNKKKKLEEKVKKQKKKIKEAEAAQDREGMASFLLPGKWLEIYKKNEQSRINEMKSNLSKDQEALQKLEKATAPKTAKKQPKEPPVTTVQKVAAAKPKAQTTASTITKETEQRIAGTMEAKTTPPTKKRPPESVAPQLPTPSLPAAAQQSTTAAPQRMSSTATPASPSSKEHSVEKPRQMASTTVPTQQQPTTRKERSQPFADLFNHPEVKGARPRSPTQLQGEAARQAAIDKDKRFEKSQQEVRTQEQRATKKKPSS